MSSLAAVQADGFYYDPLRFDPSKRGRGSVNALAGSHHLGVRAKRIGEGILVVRFELPHDGWCQGCGRHIARGVRFNADKRQVGTFHSTPILEFSMKCASCPTTFVIKTNPEAADYDFVSGIKKKAAAFTGAGDAAETGAVTRLTAAERAAIDAHSLRKLEQKAMDEARAQREAARLQALVAVQHDRWADDYTRNKQLRATARLERKAAAADLAAARARGVLVPLLPASAADHERASAMMSARAAGMTQSSLRTLADAPAHVVTGVAASLPAHAAPAVRGAPVTRTGGALVSVGAKRSRAALDAASNGQHARTAASIAAAHVATRTLVAAAPWKRMDTDRVRVPEQLLQELAQAAARKLDACSSAAATMPKIVRRMADDGLAAAGSPPATR